MKRTFLIILCAFTVICTKSYAQFGLGNVYMMQQLVENQRQMSQIALMNQRLAFRTQQNSMEYFETYQRDLENSMQSNEAVNSFQNYTEKRQSQNEQTKNETKQQPSSSDLYNPVVPVAPPVVFAPIPVFAPTVPITTGPSQQMCIRCHGNGKCNMCHGTCYVSGMYGQEGRACTHCNGGMCNACGGTGSKTY